MVVEQDTNSSIATARIERNTSIPSSRAVSIAAVVVTYNRLSSLKPCLDALYNQTRKLDEIIVVNNGSSDGTYAWLKSCDSITVINQDNQGGAGGFATGLATSFSKAHDWVWCMDDDCFPTATSLEALEMVASKIGNKYPVLNSKKFETSIWPVNSKVVRATMAAVERAEVPTEKYSLRGVHAGFFNGTLVHRRAFTKVGNVNKELIIWGDEINYYMRCRNEYGCIPVAESSLVLHPLPQEISEAADWKKYFLVRNSVYNAIRFSRFGPVGLVWVLYLRLCEVVSGQIGLKIFLTGCIAGLVGKLGWHNPYLAKDPQ